MMSFPFPCFRVGWFALLLFKGAASSPLHFSGAALSGVAFTSCFHVFLLSPHLASLGVVLMGLLCFLVELATQYFPYFRWGEHLR